MRESFSTDESNSRLVRLSLAVSKKKTLAKGIYRDGSGIAIRISVQGKPVDFRRDGDGRSYDGRELGWLRQERIRRQAAATLTAERKADAGTLFRADVDRFLDTLSSDTHRLNSQGYMAHWTHHFGDRKRDSLTAVEVQTAFAAIRKAHSTKRHIRHALISFYQTLNGRDGYNPARTLPRPPKAKTTARAIPYVVIERIFAALQPSRSRARLKVMAYVGLPPALIAKLQPSDLRLDDAEVTVKPRRKGAGSDGRTLPLSDAGVAALREFADLGAFGSFQGRQLVDTFRAGAVAAGVTLAGDARPYDLRHSFITEVYRETGDLKAASELAVHSTLEQTVAYARGAITERATMAIRAVPRFSTTAPPSKSPIRSTSVRRTGRPNRAGKGKRTAKHR